MKSVLFLSFFFICTYDKSPKISVIIPAYNSEKWISDCLFSVAKQTLRDLQIICVDDGSSDKTLLILKEFAKNDDRVFVAHQNNCGVSCARNAGLSVATGEYVTFVDSDDILINLTGYEIAYKKAKENDVDVVVWGLVFGDRNNKSYVRCSEETVIRGVDSARFFLPQSDSKTAVYLKMYRRMMLKNNNITFDQSTRYGEDLLFNFDIVPIVKSIYCINESFYFYGHSSTGLISNRKVSDEETLVKGIQEHLIKLKNHVGCKNCVEEEDINGVEKYLEKCRKRIKRHKKKERLKNEEINLIREI